MRVLHISTYDRKGGASIAAFRLHEALIQNGVHSDMLVMKSYAGNIRIFSTTHTWLKDKINTFRLILEKLVFLFYEKSASVRFQFSTANFGEDISRHPLVKNASVIHLHWINHSFISLDGLKRIFLLGKPVVWTFHDMWAFTGGCHHSFDCEGYSGACGYCPYLRKNGKNDLSNIIHNNKEAIYIKNNFLYVCVSKWLYSRAVKSSLLRNMKGYIIPNIIDCRSFNSLDKTDSRKKLNLPIEGDLLLYSSVRLDDPVKGLNYLTEALKILVRSKTDRLDNLNIVLFGKRIKDNSVLNEIPVKFIIINDLNSDAELSALYSAADVTIVSSLYETFSLVACESLACSTPVVAFDHSGPKDIIDHKKNGYLASYKSSEDLAAGILWGLKNHNRSQVKQNCRDKVLKKFDYPAVVVKYKELYESLFL